LPAICWTSFTMRRRSTGSLIRLAAALPILAVSLVRHFKPLMGKLFVLTLDLGIAGLICVLFALGSPCTVIVGAS
jgi:hypothetical protein